MTQRTSVDILAEVIREATEGLTFDVQNVHYLTDSDGNTWAGSDYSWPICSSSFATQTGAP